MNPTGRILVVDDEPHNRELLNDLLSIEGHTVAEAANGQEALVAVVNDPPDVILLDVMMPVMDGFEVCRQLKGNPATAAIPVILITSVTDRVARLMGIKAGANDFLTKPIDREDVMLRARNAIFTKQLFDQVQDNLSKLKVLERLRDDLTHMLVHDLRSPLSGIKGYLELLQPSLADRLNERESRYLDNAYTSATWMVEMLSAILDVSRMESGRIPLQITQCDLRQVIQEAIRPLASQAELKQILVHIEGDALTWNCDGGLVGRVVTNLVANALRFSPEDGEIRIRLRQEANEVMVVVSDNGPGIPLEHQTNVFSKFEQVTARKQRHMYSSGLGLTFCKMAIEAHGGRIGVESTVGRGSDFWFALPLQLSERKEDHEKASAHSGSR